MPRRPILAPALALLLGLAALAVGPTPAGPLALRAQSATETATPGRARGGRQGGNQAATRTVSRGESQTATRTAAPQSLVAALHTGSCRRPDDPAAFTLATVGPELTDAGAPAQEADIRGKLTTSPILTGTGSVAAAFDSLLDPQQPYVLIVHEGTDATGTAVACGEVAGVVVNGQLTFALRPLGSDGYAGIAVLAPSDDGGTAATVIVFTNLTSSATQAERTPRAGSGQGTGGGRGTGGGGGGGGGGRGQSGGGGGGGGGGGQGAGPGIEVSGGLDAGQDQGTRTPRARRTPTAEETAPAGTETPVAGSETPAAASPPATLGETIAVEPTAVETTVPEPTAAETTVPEPTAEGLAAEPTASDTTGAEPTADTSGAEPTTDTSTTEPAAGETPTS